MFIDFYGILLYCFVAIVLDYILETFIEVKVVVVFDAMLSGLPTHKEDFAG